MIDKQFFKSMHEEYCTQHQIIEDWYKPLTDDDIKSLKHLLDVELFDEGEYGMQYNIYGIEEFARAVEELIRTKNEL